MFGGFFKKSRRPGRKSPQPLRWRPTLEGLEERVVPAGTVNVSFANGIVNVTGDSNPNGINITQTGSDGYTITGITGATGGATTIAEVGPFPGNATITVPPNNTLTIPVGDGVTGFNIQMGASGALADEVHLIGDGTPATVLANNMFITSTGNLTIQDSGVAATDHFDIGGQLLINHSTPGAVLTVSLTTTADFGSIMINQGNGGGAVTINGDSVGGPSQVAGPISLNFGGGNNVTNLGSVAALSSGLSIGSYLSYVGGAGNDAITLKATTVVSNFDSSMGSGVDAVTVDQGSQIQGNLVGLGGGTENFTVQNGSTVTGYTSLNTSASPNTTVLVANSTLNAFLSVVAGNGLNRITLDGSTTLNGPLGFQASGNVTLQIGGQAAATTTTINGNIFQTSTAGILTETVLIGTNTPLSPLGSLESTVNITGYLSINAASATGNVSVTVDGNNNGSTTVPTLGSFLSVVSGSGNDTVDILNGAVIASEFAYNLGSGAATVLITGPTTQILGNVFQQDPGAGVTTNNFALVQAATVSGYVSINSASATGACAVVIDGTGLFAEPNQIGNYLSVVTGTGNDTVTLNSTTIGNAFGFELGAGDDLLQTDGNTMINGPFWGDFATGNDKMLIQTALGAINFAGIGVVFGGAGLFGNYTVDGSMNPATLYPPFNLPNPLNFINMGAGNDSVQLGANANNQFIYAFNLPAVIVAGSGIGNDTINTNMVNGQSTSVSFPGGSNLQLSGFSVFQ